MVKGINCSEIIHDLLKKYCSSAARVDSSPTSWRCSKRFLASDPARYLNFDFPSVAASNTTSAMVSGSAPVSEFAKDEKT